MWIPGPLYESLPYLYVVGGVLFISGTLYIGLESEGAALYIICGLISICSGLLVFVRRQNARQEPEDADTAENG